jgi:hypothetical protein
MTAVGDPTPTGRAREPALCPPADHPASADQDRSRQTPKESRKEAAS